MTRCARSGSPHNKKDHTDKNNSLPTLSTPGPHFRSLQRLLVSFASNLSSLEAENPQIVGRMTPWCSRHLNPADCAAGPSLDFHNLFPEKGGGEEKKERRRERVKRMGRKEEGGRERRRRRVIGRKGGKEGRGGTVKGLKERRP